MDNYYFFVPATKRHKIESVKDLGINHIIIDLEDAVMARDRMDLVNEVVSNYLTLHSCWIRIPIHDDSGNLDFEWIRKLTQVGFNRIVLPKLKSEQEFQHVTSKFHGLNVIVLVENSRILLELADILRKDAGSVKAVGLGSHDLMLSMNATHSEATLNFPRNYLRHIGNAFGVETIDVASMNIHNKDEFYEELDFGKQLGYLSKFILHPKQLEWCKAFKEYNDGAEVDEAHELLKAAGNINLDGEINPFLFKGRIIEKPHIIAAMNKTNKI